MGSIVGVLGYTWRRMRFSRVTIKVTSVISYNSRYGMCKLTRPQDPPSRGFFKGSFKAR